MFEYEIWFSLAKLPSRIKKELCLSFESISDMWQHFVQQSKSDYRGLKIPEALKEAWRTDQIRKINEKMGSMGIKAVSLYSSSYPKNLRNIEDSPAVLFYRGNIDKLNGEKNVSIVGSRNSTHYGYNISKIITEVLCRYDINVISGMAKGIDTYCHKWCLESGGYTCAVLGSGIDVVYPRENLQLYKSICNEGCVISEFLPGTEPFAYNFPIRNRIISALSDLIIVVEAGMKSGSLVTAGLALEQGKDVLAVPGSLFSEQSKGANKLIKDGAYIFTDTQDLLDILKLEPKGSDFEKKRNYNELQLKIFDTLSNNPIHIDDIIRITKVDIKQIYEVLFELQLKNEILCLSGNFYVKINDCI